MLYFRNDNNGAINLDGLIKIGKGTVANADNLSDVRYYENTFDFVDGGRYRITYSSVEERDDEYKQIHSYLRQFGQAF